MNSMKERLWFAAKRYGYGWYPVTWEGWLTVGLYCIFLLGPLSLLPPMIGTSDPSGFWFTMMFLPYACVLTAILIWISFKKGEAPRWRWGGE